MKTETCLERLLNIFSKTFDICRPVNIEGTEYPAYGYYFSLSEKYVATKKVNLWSTRMYEHILFMHVEECTEETVSEARRLIEGYMERNYVRREAKYPEKDHMVSYITICILTDHTPDDHVIRKIRQYKYVKNYLFTFRGRSEGRLICVDLECEVVSGNRSAMQVLNIYKSGLNA